MYPSLSSGITSVRHADQRCRWGRRSSAPGRCCSCCQPDHRRRDLVARSSIQLISPRAMDRRVNLDHRRQGASSSTDLMLEPAAVRQAHRPDARRQRRHQLQAARSTTAASALRTPSWASTSRAWGTASTTITIKATRADSTGVSVSSPCSSCCRRTAW